jgi:putative thioredoxin
MTVSDVSELQFEGSVLARSKERPVVVDFWAPWCAPCRSLGPILEREVTALGGRVELAKVDVDQAQTLSGRFEVQGIPAVMAFRDGEVVASFTGARDAGFVRKWLADLAPSDAARALAEATDEASLLALVADPEVGQVATLRLAQLLVVAARPAEALKLLEHVRAPEAEPLRQRASLALEAELYGGEPAARAALSRNPDDLEARWALAAALLTQAHVGPALDELLELVKRSRAFRADGARKAMVTLFEQLGHQHELTRDYRRRLQTIL